MAVPQDVRRKTQEMREERETGPCIPAGSEMGEKNPKGQWSDSLLEHFDQRLPLPLKQKLPGSVLTATVLPPTCSCGGEGGGMQSISRRKGATVAGNRVVWWEVRGLDVSCCGLSRG